MEKKYFTIEPQHVELTGIELAGTTLDVGGGGEGVIGRLKKEQIIVIDKRKDELEEASGDGVKVIMDAKDMQFLDNSFGSATSFFTMMYMPPEDHEQVLQEIYRVLGTDGRLFLWDVTMPARRTDEEIFVVPLRVKIEEKIIETGYGVLWDKEQNLLYFAQLAQKTGFTVVESKENGATFFLQLKK